MYPNGYGAIVICILYIHNQVAHISYTMMPVIHPQPMDLQPSCFGRIYTSGKSLLSVLQLSLCMDRLKAAAGQRVLYYPATVMWLKAGLDQHVLIQLSVRFSFLNTCNAL